MAVASLDDDPSACSRCEYFAHETARDVPKIRCPKCGREILDVTILLSRISIPFAILVRIPESFARECNVIPFEDDFTGLVVVTDLFSLTDDETFDKLRFILNRRVTSIHADREAIRQAIGRHYD